MRRLLATAAALRMAALGLLVVAATGSAAFGQLAGLEAMLKRFDANGNGQLEVTEVPSQYRTLIDRAATQAGLDTNKPIAVDRLLRAARGDDEEDNDRGRDRRDWWRDRGDRGDRGRDRDRRDSDRSNSQQVSLVPGFGADPSDPDAVVVPGFGSPGDGTAAIPLEDRYDERVLRNVDREILDRYDHNRNGMIDGDEWREVPWRDDPKQDDKNGDGRLTREELAGRIARHWGFGEKRPDGESRDRRDDRERGGRDRGDRDRGDGGDGEDEEAKTRRYATGFIASYDKNKDGFLTPDEWKNARTDVQAADSNHDNRVDANELTRHWIEANRRRLEARGGGNDRGSRDSGSSGGKYRFDTAHERLPKGTPSWFIDKDANEDGQVAMAEYATSWTDSIQQEFAKYDGNNDGIITPYEAMNPRSDAAPRATDTVSVRPSSGPSSGSSSSSGREAYSRSDRGNRDDRDRRDSSRRRGGFFRGG